MVHCKKTPQTSYTLTQQFFWAQDIQRYTNTIVQEATTNIPSKHAFVQDLENSMFWEHTQKTRVLPRASTLMTMQLWLMHHFFPQENLHTSLASPILFAHHATNQARSRVSIPFEVCQKCPVQYQDLFLDLEKKKYFGYVVKNPYILFSLLTCLAKKNPKK